MQQSVICCSLVLLATSSLEGLMAMLALPILMQWTYKSCKSPLYINLSPDLKPFFFFFFFFFVKVLQHLLELSNLTEWGLLAFAQPGGK